MAPRTGTRQTSVPDRLTYAQRTERGQKRKLDEIATRRGISTNALINELIEQFITEDERELVTA